MKIFTYATSTGEPRTKESLIIAYCYALILLVFVLAQLFTFDKFLVILEDFALPGGDPVAHLIGGLLVASEVLALPFLLRLKLSPLMRVVSMVLGWFVPLVWLILSIWILISNNPADNIGFFGTVVKILPGWWSGLVSVSLGILAAWASWGMWPIKPSKNHK